MNTFRNILLTILTCITLCLFAFVVVVGLRIEADVRQVADKVSAVAARVDAGVATVNTTVASVGTKIDTAVGRLDKAIDQAPGTVEKAVSDAINPLPKVSALPSLPAFFHQSTPTPNSKHP